MKTKVKYTKISLKSGLSLVTISGLSTRAVTLGAYIRAGFRFDPQNRPGLSHFTEHIVFSGTKSFPTPRKVAQIIEQYGGWHRAFTWIENQKHTIHLPTAYFETGLKLLMETIFNPLIKEAEVKKEKGVIKEEILRNKADPSKAVWEYSWFPLFFQGTELAQPYSGTEADIERISKKDIKLFISNYFRPDRIVLFVAGDLKEDYIREALNRYSNLYSKNNTKVKIENNITPKIKRNRLVYQDRSYYQTSLAIGIKTVPFRSSLKYIFDILQEMLAGYLGTPLIQQLRNEGGLIYTWHSFQDNLSDIGYLVINVSTAHENVGRVVLIMLKEFKRFAQGKFNKEEVKMAKNHLIGSILVNTETGLDYIEWYGLQELLNPEKVLSIEDKIGLYKKIDVDDVVQVARKYFLPSNIFISAIGGVNESSLSPII